MANNWHTIGHDKAIAALARSLSTERMAHAWLFSGPPHVGKMTLAMDLARLVNCTAEQPLKPCAMCRQCTRITDSLHADIRILSHHAPDPNRSSARTAISVDQIREIQREAVLKPYEGKYRVFIIEDAETFTQEAANALLKMLEEPPYYVIFVLLASQVRENTADESASNIAYTPEHTQDKIAALLESVPEVGGILPTILSRCKVLELRPLPTPIIQAEIQRRFDIPPQDADEIARISNGKLGWAIQAASDPQMLLQRNERLDQIETVLASELEDKFAYAERQAATFRRSRNAVYDELQLWLEWWRDVLVISAQNQNLVVNASRIHALQTAAADSNPTQIVAAIRAVQETIAMLESNVNPRLCIEGMMLRMPPPKTQAPTTHTQRA